jgi:hypothetical protein
MLIKLFTFNVCDHSAYSKHSQWSYGSAMVALHEGQHRPTECK